MIKSNQPISKILTTLVACVVLLIASGPSFAAKDKEKLAKAACNQEAKEAGVKGKKRKKAYVKACVEKKLGKKKVKKKKKKKKKGKKKRDAAKAKRQSKDVTGKIRDSASDTSQ